VLIAARTATFEQLGKAIDGDNWQHLCTVAPQRAET
jgi:hypothetical protein